MRLKPKGFIESSTLGAIMNGRREGSEGCAEGEGAEGWMPIYVLPASGRGFAFAKQGNKMRRRRNQR